MDYGVNGNGMDGEFKGNVLILETGKLFSSIKTYILRVFDDIKCSPFKRVT